MAQADELFCIGQKAVIKRGYEVLVLHDPLPAPGNIDLPGGKIQVGERDFVAALKREVTEETGLSIKVGKPFFTSYWEFVRGSGHRNEGKKIFLIFYACEYIHGNVELSSEHDWYRWVNKDTFKSSFDNPNTAYQALHTYFSGVQL